MAQASTRKDPSSFADFLQLLRLRLPLILLLWGLVFLTTLVITALMPKWYLAEVSVRVEKPEGKEKLFQANTAGFFDPYFLQDQFKILQSSKVLYPVIEKLDLNQRLAKTLGFSGGLATDQTYDYLVRSMLRVDAQRGSSLIEVGVWAQTPQMAAEIANEIVKVYAEDRIQFATSEQREGLAQLRREMESQERVVSDQRDQIEKLRKDLSISGVDLNARYSDMEIETLRQMQSSLIGLSVEAIGRKTRFERFHAIPVDERVSLINSELIQDQNIQNLLQAYFVSDQNVTKLKARLGEAHPDLIAAVDNRGKIREQLDAQLKGYESALEIAFKEAEARVNELKGQLAQAKVDQILSARDRMRPFEEAAQKLEDETRLLSTLKVNLRQREIDFQVPRRSIEILNAAEAPRRAGRPSWTVNLSLAGLLGGLLAVGAAVMLEMLDSSLRSVAEVEAKLGRPVLAVVPRVVAGNGDNAGDADPAEAEPYRVLHANLGLAKTAGKGAKTLVIVSAGPGEGKSTTLFGLAKAMGEAGERVLLIDSDLRRPTQHELTKGKRGPGLGEWLAGKAELSDVVQPAVAGGVDFIASGTGGTKTLSLLYADRLQELVTTVSGRYDRILFDAPPVIGVSDTAVLVKLADVIVLVVQHRRNPSTMVERAQFVLRELGKEITGVVLNGVGDHAGEDYGYYTRNYAYYRKDTEESPGEKPAGKRKEKIRFKE